MPIRAELFQWPTYIHTTGLKVLERDWNLDFFPDTIPILWNFSDTFLDTQKKSIRYFFDTIPIRYCWSLVPTRKWFMLLAALQHEFSMGSDLRKVHVVGRYSTCFFPWNHVNSALGTHLAGLVTIWRQNFVPLNGKSPWLSWKSAWAPMRRTWVQISPLEV